MTIPLGVLSSFHQTFGNMGLNPEFHGINWWESGGVTTYTPEATIDFGEPHSERVILVGISSPTNLKPTAATIAGVPATIGYHPEAGAYGAVFFIWAVVPTGTSGLVSITCPILVPSTVFASWSLVGPVAATAENNRNGASTSVATLTLNTKENDAVFAIARTRQQGSLFAETSYTGVENQGILVAGGGVATANAQAGMLDSTTSSGDLAVAHSMSAISQGHAMAAMAFARYDPPHSGFTVFDSFNRTNSPMLGISDSGHLWKHVSTGRAGIIDGTVYRASGYPTLSYLDFGQQDMEVSVREIVSSTNFPKVGARLNADGSGGYWTSRNSAGLVKLVGYGGTFPIVPGDRLGLRVVEGVGVTHVSLLINSVVMITWNDSNPSRPTGTYAALDIGNVSTDRADDFLVVSATPNYWSTDSQLLSDEYDCGVDHSVVAHASAAHTTGPQFVTDTGSSFGVSSATGLLTSGSNTGYAGRVIADVGQPEVKVSARIKGMLTSRATAADRHYGLVLGAHGVDDASGAVGLHANMGGLISLQQISGSAWLQNLANTGVTFTVTDDFVITLQVKGNLALATVNGRQAMLYLTNPPTGTFAGLYVSRSRWDNTYGYDNITIEAL